MRCGVEGDEKRIVVRQVSARTQATVSNQHHRWISNRCNRQQDVGIDSLRFQMGWNHQLIDHRLPVPKNVILRPPRISYWTGGFFYSLRMLRPALFGPALFRVCLFRHQDKPIAGVSDRQQMNRLGAVRFDDFSQLCDSLVNRSGL